MLQTLVLARRDVAVLIAIVLGTVLLRAFYRLFFHSLAQIPGPRLARVTQAWLTKQYMSGNWHDTYLELHQKYGSIVRIAPNEVSFVDAETLKKLYSYSRAAPKAFQISPRSIFLSDIIRRRETNNKERARRRRQVATAYNMTAVLSAETLIRNIANTCWDQFRCIASTHEQVDLDFWVTGFAYDVVGALGFWEPFNFMSSGTDQQGIMDSVLADFIKMGSMGHVPGQMIWYSDCIAKAISRYMGNDSVSAYGKFVSGIDKRILDRRERGKVERRDMLQYFFEAKTDAGLPLPYGDILSECRNVIGAGADTTSIGIKAVLGYLLQNPNHLAELRRAIEDYYNMNGLPNHEITYNQCLEIPLLQAVIKESTPLHPSIMFQLPRYVPPEGVTIAGSFIPGRHAISMSPRSHNRSKDIFGEDADEWRPERWLEDESKTKYMDSLLTTFGYGSRTCVGKNIALVELNKFVAQCLRQFDLKLVDKSSPFKLYTLWFSIQQEFWVTFQSRNVEEKEIGIYQTW